MQGAGIYAAGDALAAVEKHNQKGQDETLELLSLRSLGYFFVAVNLTSTFAYNIICKRALKKMELQVCSTRPLPLPLSSHARVAN